MELQSQLNEGKFSQIFNDENIRMFRTIFTDFRQRTSKLYGNIIRKNLTDLSYIFIFKKLSSNAYCLKNIYFYNHYQCWYGKIGLNQQNNQYK
jgi:hypothetical protein